MNHLKKLKERWRDNRLPGIDETCYVCGGKELETAFSYDRPPLGETKFNIDEGQYWRDYLRCKKCGHMMSVHLMDLGDLYSKEYVRATYGNQMKKQFERIIALPTKQSDNAGRVDRVNQFVKGKTLLDVGSGLCVFLHGMKKAGWRGTALDPDEAACRQAREVVGVEAVCADFMRVELRGKYDLVTFNKVLEHVRTPLVMLAKASRLLKTNGVVYVEVPDGELAAQDKDGKEREEFYIEHRHVFSATSLEHLFERAGFVVDHSGRLREPSGKYTLWAFGSRKS